MKKRWIIMMTLMVIISLIGVFTPETAGVWEPDEKMNTANVAWMITATIFVLMMTPGLSFFYGGMVGKKNVISTILQSFIAMGIISVIWVVFVFSLAFGDDIGGFVGNPSFGALCTISNEICHYHPFPYHRIFCRTRPFFRIYGVHDFVLYLCILPACTLDLAS